MKWRCRDTTCTFDRPLVMGILNVTPDSFSDGGLAFGPAVAVARGLQLVAEGADVLDIGGESTRPNATPVPADEELRRVLPVVRELAGQIAVPISVDTMKADVAAACLDAGAAIINDVAGLRDPAMLAVCANREAGVVVMHMRGMPTTMQVDPHYGDVVAEVGDYFGERLQSLADAGIAPERVALDPGIGFGKTEAHTWAQLRRLGEYRRFGRPICLGVSRKGFLGQLLGRPRHERWAGSLAVACHAVVTGGAQVLRVHDVAATADAIRVLHNLAPGATP